VTQPKVLLVYFYSMLAVIVAAVVEMFCLASLSAYGVLPLHISNTQTRRELKM